MMTKLSVYSIFHSISGETGVLPQGTPVTFVRLAGCNLRCLYCDTEKTWEKSAGTLLGGQQIYDKIKAIGCKNILITGGEPLMQAEKLVSFIYHLHHLGFNIHIETNGRYSRPHQPSFKYVTGWVVDYKTPSSGMENNNSIAVLKTFPANQTIIKLVCADRQDFASACDVAKFLPRYTIAVSPVLDKLPAATLAKWVLESPNDFILNVQIHKWIWPKGEKGDE